VSLISLGRASGCNPTNRHDRAIARSGTCFIGLSSTCTRSESTHGLRVADSVDRIISIISSAAALAAVPIATVKAWTESPHVVRAPPHILMFWSSDQFEDENEPVTGKTNRAMVDLK
jgi:hypothetical protein